MLVGLYRNIGHPTLVGGKFEGGSPKQGILCVIKSEIYGDDGIHAAITEHP
jgi:hypothetical protein